MARGIGGAVAATIAIFLPAFLLVVGTLPFWNELRSSPRVHGALTGINAAVVGILLAALYNPLWTTSIQNPADFAFALFLFILLVYWKCPPWIIVLAGALGGILIAYV
jgi:chromate transporter